LPLTDHNRKPTRASEEELSVDAWMELFYASLLDHDPAKLAPRLERVKRSGNSRKLHRAASHSERQILRAALKAIDDFELLPARDQKVA
jgi:hypothetical protein